MHDQAEQLREKLSRHTQARQTRLVTVTSGKGGVGKSNFTLNFALGLLAKGQKVLIFDVDFGLANLDVLMGLTPKKHLLDLLEQNASIWDIIEKGPNGLEFIAGGSGFTKLLQMDEQKIDKCFEQFNELQGYADVIFLDTGAGISPESLRFMLASDEVLLVTTPEPTSITDAYAVIKMIHSHKPQTTIRMIINRASSPREGKNTADKLAIVAKRFLDMELETLGYVADDANVSKAVKQQEPFLLAYPRTPASTSIVDIVETYIGNSTLTTTRENEGLRGFLSKIRKFIR